jgi:hypothetical protein
MKIFEDSLETNLFRASWTAIGRKCRGDNC